MTNVDIEANFQIGYDNLLIIVDEAKIVLNTKDTAFTHIAADSNWYQYIIGPDASQLQYLCTKISTYSLHLGHLHPPTLPIPHQEYPEGCQGPQPGVGCPPPAAPSAAPPSAPAVATPPWSCGSVCPVETTGVLTVSEVTVAVGGLYLLLNFLGTTLEGPEIPGPVSCTVTSPVPIAIFAEPPGPILL